MNTSDLTQALADSGPRLLSLVRRYLPNPDDAGDVVQDALVSALRSLPAFEGRAALATWLHRIALNAVWMELRRRRRLARWLPTDGAVFEPSDHPDDRTPSVEERLVDRERRAWLRRGLDALPARHREVLGLRDLGEVNVEFAARRLGITPVAVRVRHLRARRALRRALEASPLEGAGRRPAWLAPAAVS